MNTLRRHAFLLLGLLLSLAACSSLDHAPTAARPARDWETELMHNAGRIKNMSPAELSAEADSLNKAWASRRSEENRLQLALFLALAPPPPGDRNRAISLLDVSPSEQNGRGRIHPLAQILLPLLQDNRRLEEAQASSQQKLRELQLSNEQMRQKLDALREIETRMQERPKNK